MPVFNYSVVKRTFDARVFPTKEEAEAVGNDAQAYPYIGAFYATPLRYGSSWIVTLHGENRNHLGYLHYKVTKS